ncbi:hypothetical protein [Enterovirga sp.]|uniref:hypothetical protein n=1 Tax=Enterovirga sp. TaxID=2026350 RepID=UPI002C683E1C|nr:hypothetical protein [Enterovirga sp.]HMO28176.1 hypothetical protein [Enterovirga sp.]
MSEIERHDDERPGSPAGKEGSAALGRAAEALKSAGDSAAHAVENAVERLREGASEGYERAQNWAHESYESVSREAAYARRRSAVRLDRGRRGVEDFVEQNPLMVGVAGFAAGLLIGALLPGTRHEKEWLGPYADDVRREGVRYAKDAVQQGRESLAENLRAMTQPREP